jgi:hypothetical protein
MKSAATQITEKPEKLPILPQGYLGSYRYELQGLDNTPKKS